MRKFRIFCACAIAALGITAAESASASAASPELGRCVKVEGVKEGKKTVYKGHYSSRNCVHEAKPGHGRYEWEAGPGEEKEYENTGELEPATLETTAGTAISCMNHKLYGEYTGATTETATLALYECTNAASEPCTSLLEEGKPELEKGRIVFEALEGTLGVISTTGSKPKVGWDLKPKTGSTAVTFECGATQGLGTKYVVEGSVIGEIKPVNHMHEEFKGNWRAAGGVQNPKSFEGGAEDTLKATILSGLEAPKTEAIGLTMLKEEVSTVEAYEYRV